MTPTLLGVRHHGPGSARAVRAALEQIRPEVVLVEGPPEAAAVVELAGEAHMRPPVALLAHTLPAVLPGTAQSRGTTPGPPGPRTPGPGAAPSHPMTPGAEAAFWPFAEFSPEWVAIRYALARGVPVRFIDLPAAHTFAIRRNRTADGAGEDDASQLRIDPLAYLAATAGYDDPERWWEDAVEHRLAGDGDAGPLAQFAAIADAMGALRERYGAGGHRDDLLREAHMRLRIRAATREFDRVAVVCGAWHVPALAEQTTLTADRELLKGLPKAKVEVTWIPWTNQRLGRHSGYGAGIASPGWYQHLFAASTNGDRTRVVARWLTRLAGLLREADYPVSSAHIIESVRLAEALAVMRGRPLAGLTETMDAARAVMCDGSDIPLGLIYQRMVVGDDIGEVPEEAPAVPLQRDLARTQRTLRLKPAALERELELDLRKEIDAARSRLLHRLRLLGIAWGEPIEVHGATGTFREAWRLRWEPELAVRVAEAGVWGVTVVAAATAKAEDTAGKAESLAAITALAERCLLADVPDALPTVMRVLADRAALDADVGHLAQALPALVRSVRYGDVRGTDSAALRSVAEGLARRVCVGLPPACFGLDADGAAEMRTHLDAAHVSIGLLRAAGSGTDLGEQWSRTLLSLATGAAAASGPRREPLMAQPHLLRGRATRLLLDGGDMAADEAARLMGLALSPGTPPDAAAAWVEGFLAGGGMLLIHDERLLTLVDNWLTAVPADMFTDVLPLLRRTFAGFEPGVLRTVGELVRRGAKQAQAPVTAAGPASGFGPELDAGRADAVLPTLRLILGRSRIKGEPQ